ncbi:hypothetical protein ACLOJK_037537 [Asimina triloba]
MPKEMRLLLSVGGYNCTSKSLVKEGNGRSLARCLHTQLHLSSQKYKSRAFFLSAADNYRRFQKLIFNKENPLLLLEEEKVGEEGGLVGTETLL